MVVLNSLGWLDFSGYSAAAISLGLLMFLIGFSSPGREYFLFQHIYIYYSSGILGIILVGHGLYSLYQDRIQRKQRRARLTESMFDYLQSVGPNSGLPGIADEDDELPEVEYEESLMEVINER